MKVTCVLQCAIARRCNIAPSARIDEVKTFDIETYQIFIESLMTRAPRPVSAFRARIVKARS